MVLDGWGRIVLQAVVEIGCADDRGRGCDCANKLLGAYDLRGAKYSGVVGVLGDSNTNFAQFGLLYLLACYTTCVIR